MLSSVLSCELTLRSPSYAQGHAPSLAGCSGFCILSPLGRVGVGPSPAPRYRRPRQCVHLSPRAPLLMRLAARGAMPSHPSLLPTIMEVDESLYLGPNYLARSPSSTLSAQSCSPAPSRSPTPSPPGPYAAKCDESSRKRRTPDPEACTYLGVPIDLSSDLRSHMCLLGCQMPVESLQAMLTPDAMEHWKRLRGPTATTPDTLA